MSEENENQTAEASSNSKTSWSSLAIAGIAVLIAGFSCFQYYQAQQNLMENNAAIKQLKTTSRINSVKLDLLQQKNRSLQTNILQLVRQNSPINIALNETADLVRAAQMALSLNNTNSAIQYLQLARQQIAAVNDATLQNISTALNQNISILKAATTIDQNSLISQLDAIGKSVGQLPTAFDSSKTAKQIKISPKPENPYEELNWKQRLLASLQYLKSFVAIRHNSELPTLTPEQQTSAKLILQLKLIEAQWAVINLQDPLYQQALNFVSDSLQNNYQHSEETAAILEQLKGLQQIHLQSPSVNLTRILSLISAHIKTVPASIINPTKLSAPTQATPEAKSAAPAATPPIHSSVEA